MFRNLAKMSRPKKNRKRDGGEKSSIKGVGRNEVALIEVCEDEESDGEDLSRLLGEDVGRRLKWRGSTRLLLLDEQYANKRTEDLPEAIKVVFQEHDGKCTRSTFQLVKCKLTLFYDYWQMNEVLEALLPKGMAVPSAFETVGHIAHLNLRDEHLPYKNLIAKVFNMDGRRFIEAVFTGQKGPPITQIVMNLPNAAAEFLGAFRGVFNGLALGKDCTLPRIHVYGFSKAQDPEFDFYEGIRTALPEAAFDIEMHRVRLVAPGKWMLCASFILPERVACFRTG